MKNWILTAIISTFAVIALVLIIVRPDTTDEDADAKPTSFGADLAFQFDCKGKANPPSEHVIEQFITAKGFKPLDKVKAGKKLIPDFSWMHLDVVGIDDARGQIAFKGFADQPDSYSVSLYSEPPTRRSEELEGALLRFTEKTLGCENEHATRLDNPADAKELYDKSFSMTEAWFHQAAGLPAASTAAAPASATR